MRICLLTLAALAHAQQRAPVIRVPVRLVTVPALVFSPDGRTVNGLTAVDFRLLDENRPQRITLDTQITPVSIAAVVQSNQDVRDYVPSIAKMGAVIDTLIAGEGGESALLTCNDDVSVAKPFDSGDLSAALKKLSPEGRSSHMLDAASRAIDLLAQRPASRIRVLLLIGQPMDSGSETKLDALREAVERENLTVFALALPMVGKAFVSDTFHLEGLSSRTDRGGFRASTDAKHLIQVLDRASAAQQSTDPFSILTAATGGTQIHFRKQSELEGALAAVGLQVRSAYVLSFAPDSPTAGYHAIHVEVRTPGSKVFARPGYWLR
jgi:VWFA-related protein